MLAAGEPVWVVVSDNAGVYAEAAAALQNDWKAARMDRELQILVARDLPVGPPPPALVTLGSAALRAAMERVDGNPAWAHTTVLSALIPKDGLQAIWRPAPPNLIAAYLDQPFERYLDLVKQAMPHLNRVGVLVGPEASTSSPAMFKAANDRGIKLSVGRVARPDSMYNTLRTVLAESDVLLVLPDASVADQAGLQNILITAYRQHIPVIAYSPALVKAGAALGLYASPAQVGRQVSGMLRNLFSGNPRQPSRMAEGYTVAINEQVCRSLGLDVPDAAELGERLKR